MSASLPKVIAEQKRQVEALIELFRAISKQVDELQERIKALEANGNRQRRAPRSN